MEFRRAVTAPLLALLLLAAQAGEALCAQPAAKARKRSVAQAQKAQAQDTPQLSSGELLHPFAGDNATAWRLDPAPTGRPFGQTRDGDDALSFRFHLKPDRIVDPLTQKELTPRADPLKARDSLRNLDLKDAMGKLGGKAEVQVDILKF
jgi:hypothetical protein